MVFGQFNIARAKYPLNDPRMAGFTNNFDRIHHLAERSKGFIWRQIESSAMIYDEPKMIWTLSVWETPQALKHFAFNTIHNRLYEARDEWFTPMTEASNVVWPIETNHRPSLTEALETLESLRKNGETAAACSLKEAERFYPSTSQ